MKENKIPQCVYRQLSIQADEINTWLGNDLNKNIRITLSDFKNHAKNAQLEQMNIDYWSPRNILYVSQDTLNAAIWVYKNPFLRFQRTRWYKKELMMRCSR